MEFGDTMAAAAMRLVGTPFRLNGRSPEHGVDCVGVIVAALASVDRMPRLPSEYTLRRTDITDFETAALEVGLRPVDDELLPGDCFVAKAGPAQFHGGVCGFDSMIVHAHAGLGRVVVSPTPLPWPLAYHWRLFTI